jgi:Fur family peroxide stress response transcriptional regulator
VQKQTQTAKIHDFIQFCQEQNLKVTPQRVAVYKELLKSDAHPTADAIYQGVKDEYPNISFDTVNRTLLTFAKTGIVDVVEIFRGAKRFDPNVENHHHLHCMQCGKILDFHSQAYDNLEVPEEVCRHFQVISKRVVLKGICEDCRR